MPLQTCRNATVLTKLPNKPGKALLQLRLWTTVHRSAGVGERIGEERVYLRRWIVGQAAVAEGKPKF